MHPPEWVILPLLKEIVYEDEPLNEGQFSEDLMDFKEKRSLFARHSEF